MLLASAKITLCKCLKNIILLQRAKGIQIPLIFVGGEDNSSLDDWKGLKPSKCGTAEISMIEGTKTIVVSYRHWLWETLVCCPR